MSIYEIVPSLFICILAALMCVASDIPATIEVCGFTGHNSTMGCSKCLKPFIILLYMSVNPVVIVDMIVALGLYEQKSITCNFHGNTKKQL